MFSKHCLRIYFSKVVIELFISKVYVIIFYWIECGDRNGHRVRQIFNHTISDFIYKIKFFHQLKIQSKFIVLHQIITTHKKIIAEILKKNNFNADHRNIFLIMKDWEG